MRGRPKKDDSRDKQYRVRLNDQENKMLDYVSESTGMQKADIFRKSLEDYYLKVRLNEYSLEPEDDEEWEMDHISLKRVIDCPFCGVGNKIDFTDECESFSEERQMGSEITYSFDLENIECISCNRRFHVSGYICEYPIGAYNYENIDVRIYDEDEE